MDLKARVPGVEKTFSYYGMLWANAFSQNSTIFCSLCLIRFFGAERGGGSHFL